MALFREILEILIISLSILEKVLSAIIDLFLTKPSPIEISPLLSRDRGPIIENPVSYTHLTLPTICSV